MILPIVDKKDRIIKYKDRSKILFDDIYRVSAIWITNSKGEILLAQRALNKNHDPGKWGPAVAGTVEKGETYLQNAIKELKEEIGLTTNKLTKGPKIYIQRKHRLFCQFYLFMIELPIQKIEYDKSEVASIRWYKKDELLKLYDKNKSLFVPSMQDCIRLLVQ